MANDRDFKGIWIPKEVWLCEELTLQEKVFYVEINSLNNENGCYANNEYFAQFFGISKVRVSEVINSLVEKGFIKAEVNQQMGNKRTLMTLANFSLRPSPINIEDPHKASFKHSNTVNNTVSNTLNNPEESKDSSLQKPLFSDSLRKSKKEKKAADPIFAKCVEVWLKEIHPGWGFKAVDGKALNGIIAQMRAYSLRKNDREPSDQQVVDFFRHLTTHLPAFYKNQTLSVINSKFDPIVDEIRTGRNPNKKQSGWDFAASFGQV